MANVNRSVLADLVAPHAAEEFLAQYWPKRHFVAHGDPARLPSFLRAPELANVETLSSRYRGRWRFTNGRKYQSMQVIPDCHGIVLYRMGLTIQSEDLAAHIPQAAAELRRLEFELGANPGACQAYAFASPVSEGLSVHFDAQEIFSIQLRGTKRFHIAPVEELPCPSGVQFVPGQTPSDDLYPQARRGFPDASRAKFTTIDMQPGSVLFMPRGTWHYTESEGDSMSVSIAVDSPSAVEYVLAQLRMLLLQDPQWRAPLYGAWGDDAARAAAVERAAHLLAQLPRLSGQLNAGSLIANLLPLEQRLALIKPKSRFQKTPNSRVDIDASSGVAITVSDQRYGPQVTARAQPPAHLTAALRWLGERAEPFYAEELSRHFPQLRFAEVQQVLRAGVESGLLRMLWFQELVEAPATPPA